MPAVGDQHKQNAATANPFEEAHADEKKHHISPYTAQEIATLQSRLDKQLGPEYISSRPGASGQKVHYLAAEKVINLANEIFGFNGWNSSIQNIQIDFVDEHPETRKINLGLSVIVRVTLKDGTYHEDVGYGHIENCKGKAAAFEKAKKEGTTDGLKRALRTFGNVLGNCVYDKDYVAKVTKIKVGAPKWDEKNLHRHGAYVPKEAQAPQPLPESKPVIQTTNVQDTPSGETIDSFIDIGDFDDAEFDDNDFGNPDETVLPVELQEMTKRNGPNQQPQRNPSMPQHMTTPSRPPYAAPAGMHAPATRPNLSNQSMPPQRTPNNGLSDGRAEPARPLGQDHTSSNEQPSSPGMPSQHFAAQGGGQPSRATGFYSARAANNVDPNNNIATTIPSAVVQFNPHSESPSIRKTAGIDHSRSGAILRDGYVPEPIPPPKKDQTDPQPDSARLGAPHFQHGPQNPASRSLNTSAYRPPTRRGMDPAHAGNATSSHPAGDRALTTAKRTPLTDMSNVQQQNHHNVTARTDDGSDAKRQRMTGPVLDGNASPPQAGNENKPVGGVG